MERETERETETERERDRERERERESRVVVVINSIISNILSERPANRVLVPEDRSETEAGQGREDDSQCQ